MKKQYRIVQGQKRRNDPEKTDWVRLGIGFSDSNGMRIKLNALPLADANGEVWINVFADDGEKRPQGGGGDNRQASQQRSTGGFDDSIPF